MQTDLAPRKMVHLYITANRLSTYHENSVENLTQTLSCYKVIKISPIRDRRSTSTYCQLQSHVTQKLEKKSVKDPNNKKTLM